jgi:hypothetical protein
VIHTKGGAEGSTRWLENGYADDHREAASILRDAAEVGIVGGSIKDWSGERIYEFNHAVERVRRVPRWPARCRCRSPSWRVRRIWLRTKNCQRNPNNNHRSAAQPTAQPPGKSLFARISPIQVSLDIRAVAGPCGDERRAVRRTEYCGKSAAA